MKNLGLFLRLSRPLFLLGGVIMYALGVGIAAYLGETINWRVYLFGQAWVTLMQLSTQYFNEYYNAPADLSNANRTYLTGGSGALGPGKLPRQVALIAGLTCLAFLASLTVVMISTIHPSWDAYLIMGIAFLGSFFYSAPPVRLEASGYGELTTTFLIAFLVPTFAFNLQADRLHRLLAMSSFPLAALVLAMLIAFELPDYANDMRHNKRTLVVRMGWQAGMGLHNILILSAFLLFLLARLFGFPWFATVAGLIPLPLGLYQVWQMGNIANGAKPNWNILTIVGLAVFAITAYLLTLAFWLH
jgi:1,4-dihydroxy-2-naphthoate octaprenyltransferase